MKSTTVHAAFAALSAVSLSAIAGNPLVKGVFTPDPAPFVHGDKVYMFTGHDENDAKFFKMKWAKKDDKAWASQAVERNGKWYWYVCCNCAQGDAIGVAVADRPEGPYSDPIGKPLAVGASFIDPTVFVDDDGRAYLFWGNKGCWYGELNADMVSFKDGWREIPGFDDEKCFGPKSVRMNWSHGKEEPIVSYEEAPWVMKRNGTYYLSYAAGGVPEHMAYSTAPTINGPWTYRGKIMDTPHNSFTIHGGNIEFKGQASSAPPASRSSSGTRTGRFRSSPRRRRACSLRALLKTRRASSGSTDRREGCPPFCASPTTGGRGQNIR